MSQIIPLTLFPALDANGNSVSGATIDFTLSGTSTPAPVYADAALTTSLGSTLTSDSAGRFPVAYADSTPLLRAQLTIGSIIQTIDPVNFDQFSSLAGGGGAALVGTQRPGGVLRTQESKNRDRFDLRDFGVVNRFDTSNEYTAEINAALTQAKSEGITTVYCEESYRVAGTITQPASVGIVSASGVSRWFENSPAGENAGPGFYKPDSGNDGCIIIRGVGAHLIGISLDHQKIGGATPAFGGVMQMGPGGSNVNFNNTLTMNCHIRGHEINEVTNLRRGTVNFSTEFGVAGTDCTLVFFPASALGYQRYWHQFINLYLENGRRGIFLNEQSNSNFFSGLRFRGVYRPVWIKGGSSESIENIVDGVWAQNYPLPTQTQDAATVAALPFAARAAAQADMALITMENVCRLNQFRGPTEGGGRAWYLSAASAAAFNDASGLINNEAFVAPVPPGWNTANNEFNGRRRWGGKTETFLALDSADDNASQGWGNRVTYDAVRTTDLPLMNGAAGPPTTGAASRIIARWTDASVMGKISRPAIACRMRIAVTGPGGGAGTHITEVEWAYRCVDNATNAGELKIKSVDQFPSANNYVAGLHFIKGITGSDRPFAISVTLGNLGAVAAADITVSMEVFAHTSLGAKRTMAEYGDINFDPIALTADDVTDAVSMLATGVTSI